MAGKTIKMEVVTPERLVFQQEVESIVVPAVEGYLGVLPNHAPLITGLEIGVVRYRRDGSEHKMAVSGGFLEVIANKAVLLADTAEKGEEINLTRALEAKERAAARLKNRAADLDVARAELSLRRAMARIQAAG